MLLSAPEPTTRRSTGAAAATCCCCRCCCCWLWLNARSNATLWFMSLALRGSIWASECTDLTRRLWQRRQQQQKQQQAPPNDDTHTNTQTASSASCCRYAQPHLASTPSNTRSYNCSSLGRVSRLWPCEHSGIGWVEGGGSQGCGATPTAIAAAAAAGPSSSCCWCQPPSLLIHSSWLRIHAPQSCWHAMPRAPRARL